MTTLSAPPRTFRRFNCSAVEVRRGDAVDIAGEAHASTIGGDIDVLGEVDAVEVEPVDAVLTFDGVVGIALIPLKDVVAGAQESDVVARAPIDHIVAAAAIERVSARQSEQDVCATVAGQNVALAASKHLFDAAQRVARGVAAAAKTGCQIDADGKRGREVADGVAAPTSDDDIGTGSALEKVVAIAADQRVVSAAALDDHVGGIIRQIDRQGPREPAAVDVHGRIGHRGAIDGDLQGVDGMPSDRTKDQGGGAVGEPDALDAVDLAEIGVRHDDRARKRQRIDAVASGHTQKAGVGDDQGVVARAAAQHVGAAIADEDVVAEATHHVVGAGIAGQDVGRGGAQMRDVIDQSPMMPEPNRT